jgi:hypothetical protein
MREHPDEFKSFVHVEVGGGSRRNPKRKNVGASSAPLDNTTPSPEQIETAWEQYLERMSRNGTYGDNIEIRAFAKAFDVDVKIYNRDNSYYLRAEEHGARPVIHVAHHASATFYSQNFEHSLTSCRPGSITHLSATSMALVLVVQKSRSPLRRKLPQRQNLTTDPTSLTGWSILSPPPFHSWPTMKPFAKHSTTITAASMQLFLNSSTNPPPPPQPQAALDPLPHLNPEAAASNGTPTPTTKTRSGVLTSAKTERSRL